MRRRIPDEHGGLIMTPMIDIVFQLIAFFIFSMSFSPQHISRPVKPPDATQLGEAIDNQPAVLIELDREGTLLGGPEGAVKIDDPSFPSGLETLLAAAKPDQLVVIRADREAAYSAVDRVLDACRARKLSKVVLRLKVNTS